MARPEATRSPPHQLLASGAELETSPSHSRQDRRDRDGNQHPFHDYQSQGSAKDLGEVVRPARGSGKSHQRIKARHVRGSPELSPLSCECCPAPIAHDRDIAHDLPAPAILANIVLAQASPDSIRIRLLKVRARVVRTTRRIQFHLAAHWPGQDLFQHCQRILAAENSV